MVLLLVVHDCYRQEHEYAVSSTVVQRQAPHPVAFHQGRQTGRRQGQPLSERTDAP